MTLPRPTAFCPMCGLEIVGRSDKIFCSVPCKSKYHQERKNQSLPYSQPIDAMLHRNWVILTEQYESIGKKKFFVSKADLNKSGFHTKYFTTSDSNKEGKIYYYVYNFGWMEFSESDIMVVRLSKSK